MTEGTGPEPAAAPLAIRLFGPLEVRVNGAPLPRLRSRKGLALLALLTLRPGSAVPRPWLAGLVERMRTPRGREAARTLQDLNRRPPSPREVLAAANAVEAVWDETRS